LLKIILAKRLVTTKQAIQFEMACFILSNLMPIANPQQLAF